MFKLIRFFKKKYWREKILHGYYPFMSFACDGRMHIPEHVYSYFSREELAEIRELKLAEHARIAKLIESL